MKTALSIAGSDSSGGAGIQADLKAMTMNGVYAMTAVTALTAQNTTGVTAILEATPQFLRQQLQAVFSDIPPDSVKIGMVSSAALIETIAQCLGEYHPRNVVVDPVMVATSGARLLNEDAVATLREKLLPLADLITPNIPEAEVLSGQRGCARPPGSSGRPTTAPCCARAATGSATPTTCSTRTAPSAGSGAGGSTTPTPTAPAAPSPAPLPPTWPRDSPWPTRSSGPRTTSPGP